VTWQKEVERQYIIVAEGEKMPKKEVDTGKARDRDEDKGS
jgi:hypothetical protein